MPDCCRCSLTELFSHLQYNIVLWSTGFIIICNNERLLGQGVDSAILKHHPRVENLAASDSFCLNVKVDGCERDECM